MQGAVRGISGIVGSQAPQVKEGASGLSLKPMSPPEAGAVVELSTPAHMAPPEVWWPVEPSTPAHPEVQPSLLARCPTEVLTGGSVYRLLTDVNV